MRVAIYARVSTDDKGQDPENQLHELRVHSITRTLFHASRPCRRIASVYGNRMKTGLVT
jgi:predicted site-specific integrase-resolvase